MKTSRVFGILLLSMWIYGAQAQESNEKVASDIDRVERMVEAHQWTEAFTELRLLEKRVQDQPSQLYAVQKQRYRMYSRLHKNKEMDNCLLGMEQLALSTGNSATIEDMLKLKAYHYSMRGDTETSRQCYISIFNRRAAGKDDNDKEACFREMIAEAKQQNNSAMVRVFNDAYSAWQDSIARIKTTEELDNLQHSYAEVQEQMHDKSVRIKVQGGTILVLCLLLLLSLAAVVILILNRMSNVRGIKRLKQKLAVSNESSQQKSLFLRNIGSQIATPLREISAGNVQSNVAALQRMLRDVETYVTLDDAKDEPYDTQDVNVADVCQRIIAECGGSQTPVTCDSTKQIFTMNRDMVQEVLVGVIKEMQNRPEVQNVMQEFKKRGPHKGHFVVTMTGLKLEAEERDTLFVAFARPCDLTKTSGLVLPICAMKAHKMGGQLFVDKEYVKGTRIVLEIMG